MPASLLAGCYHPRCRRKVREKERKTKIDGMLQDSKHTVYVLANLVTLQSADGNLGRLDNQDADSLSNLQTFHPQPICQHFIHSVEKFQLGNNFFLFLTLRFREALDEFRETFGRPNSYVITTRKGE